MPITENTPCRRRSRENRRSHEFARLRIRLFYAVGSIRKRQERPTEKEMLRRNPSNHIGS